MQKVRAIMSKQPRGQAEALTESGADAVVVKMAYVCGVIQMYNLSSYKLSKESVGVSLIR